MVFVIHRISKRITVNLLFNYLIVELAPAAKHTFDWFSTSRVYRSHSNSNWWLTSWISRVLIYILDFALIRGRSLLLSDLTTKTILLVRGIRLPPPLLYHWFRKPPLSGGRINPSFLSRGLRFILRLWLIRPVKFGIHYNIFFLMTISVIAWERFVCWPKKLSIWRLQDVNRKIEI